MKFCRTWKDVIVGLPESLADACINYKGYKKLLKRICGLGGSDASRDVLDRLVKDAEIADRAFRDGYKRLRASRESPKPVCGIWCSMFFDQQRELYSAEQLVTFARLNADCMRKICKRTDKMLSVEPGHELSKWLCKEKAGHRWSFMNGIELSVLETKIVSSTNGRGRECPICFEEYRNGLEDAHAIEVIMGCGHHICLECILSMSGANKLHGTIYNRLKNSNSVCPICRDRGALRSVEILDKL